VILWTKRVRRRYAIVEAQIVITMYQYSSGNECLSCFDDA